MKTRTIVRLALILFAMLVLAGCEVHFEFTVNADGSGPAASTIEIEPAEHKAGFTPAYIRKAMQQDAVQHRQSVEITEGKLANGNEYVKAITSFRNVQELSTRENAKFAFMKAAKDGVITFRMSDPGMAGALVPLTVQMTMPGRIISSNADFVQGRTARWSNQAVKRFAGSQDGLSVTSEPVGSKLPNAALGIAAAIAAIGAVLICVAGAHPSPA